MKNNFAKTDSFAIYCLMFEKLLLSFKQLSG